ncbi:MAG: aminotransferase class I/II-fold pyridoxal phosphate-dependent enzyme [Synergistaceae bacterium]|nr:aminotransferase class I/II-fold pyridoxal phosphate-dependent enzyme [Synergistaceae bacterium]
MQAVILAAGMGKRLKELTRNNTKCMVKVNGVTLIERMLRQLDKHNLSRVIIVIGYESEKLIKYIATLNTKTPIVYINNSIYDKTNNIYSLALASEHLCNEDTLLLESDLIFDDSVIDCILDDPRENLALVDKYESWMDGTCVKLHRGGGGIESFVPGKKFKFDEIHEYYKTVNIYKFSEHFSRTHYVPFLKAYQEALGRNEYYEQVLRIITMLDYPEIEAKKLHGQKWYEIDDIQDLEIAESIFMPNDDEKIKRFEARYGGYWRYPGLIDYCYLVNPFFPPKRLLDEIRANFDVLLTNYPSGMQVNSLLAAKNFNVNINNICPGNGAAELIKSLMENIITGNAGFIRPTFEEYPNRYNNENSIIFTPPSRDYKYDADDIIKFFADKEISALVLINPDNPSGNYINKSDINKLIAFTHEKKCKLILDESFADFADESDNSFINQEILSANKHLFIVKSISKSYGVPGLRLGILASGDCEIISHLKKDIAIWNINSFAEFFMQILGKYDKDYHEALNKFRLERERFTRELERINNLTVFHSQANFLMAEVKGISSDELAKKLLVRHNILIKNLARKTGQNYIRLAIRNQSDNNILIEALKQELN